MYKITSLSEITKIKLDTGERLGLFNESCIEKNNTVDFSYGIGWNNAETMWKYRFTDKSDLCKSLAWIAEPIQLRKRIKSVKTTEEFTDCAEILSIINKYKDSKVFFQLKKHSGHGGYFSHSTLDLFIHRMETKDDFERRSKAQIEYINLILQEKHETELALEKAIDDKDHKEFQRLKKKFTV